MTDVKEELKSALRGLWRDGRMSPKGALGIIEMHQASHLYYVEATREVLAEMFPKIRPAPLELLYGPGENPGSGETLIREIYTRAWENDGTIDVAEQKLAIQEADKLKITPREHFYVFKRAIFYYAAAHPEVHRA